MVEVVSDENLEEREVSNEGMFYAVSGIKLIVMSVFTLNLYTLYWFYKNFKCSRNRYSDQTMPFIRALLSPIFSYALFTTINSELENLTSSKKLHAGMLALLYVIPSILSQLLPPQYWLLSFLVCMPLVVANHRIIELNISENPNYQPHSKFTWINWCFLIPFGVIVCMALIGTFLESA